MINITNIAISNVDYPTDTTRNLVGNVFNHFTAVIDFEVITYAIAQADAQIEFGPAGYPDLKHIIDVNGGGMFTDFKSGDSIIITNAGANNGTYTIDVKFSDNDIRVTSALTNLLSSTSEIYLALEYTAADFYFNLIENSEGTNYFSKIDGTVQKMSAIGINSGSSESLAIQGYKSWKIGSGDIASIIRNSINLANYLQKFTISHDFWIAPFFTKDQDIEAPPSYFFNDNSLKYVFKIDAKPSATEKTRIQTGILDTEIGQSGWFNENYNTGITNYSIDNLTFTRVSDSESLDALVFNSGEKTLVEFDVLNTVDSPFSLVTKYIINFISIPQDDSEFKSTSTTMDENFSFDRAGTTVFAGAVDGVYSRAIKDFTISFNSVDSISVSFEVDLSVTVFDKIALMDVKKYLLSFIVKDTNTNISDSDQVTLLVDYNDFFIDLGLEDAVEQVDNLFIEMPSQSKDEGIISLDSFLEDEVVGYKRIKIDKSLASEDFTISSISAGIYASNGTESFELSKYTIPTDGATIVNGIEFIDSTILIPFKAPLGELVKEFKVTRDVASDANPIYYFDIYFGWINRWEYWLKNNSVSADFFNIAEPNNGLNNEWDRFDASGYSLYYFVDFNLTIGNATQTVRRQSSFTINDYNSNADWDNEDIKTYDLLDNQLINGATEYILGYENTKVVCEFEWIGAGSAPSISEVSMIMRLEPKENGGQFGSTRINSVRESGSESQWESIDISNEIVITNIGNVYYGTAKLNNFKLLNFSTYSITSRIYITSVMGGEKQFQDDSAFVFQDGSIYEFQ